MSHPTRRVLLAGAASLIGLCWAPLRAMAQSDEVEQVDAEQIYGAVPNEPFPVPAIDLSRVRPQFLRDYVAYDTEQAPGTIIIDPAHHYLYLVDTGGMAIRYGVGVGRQGFAWSGVAKIHDKRQWPDWYPPKEMLARDPSIMESMDHLQSGIGMHGGPGNPLGARAMYLFQGNKDTLYRIHGTIEPWTIGSSISSGCIRMINQDVMDLYDRVPVGTTVVVLGNSQPSREAARRRGAPQPYDPNSQYYPDPQAGAGQMPSDPAYDQPN